MPPHTWPQVQCTLTPWGKAIATCCCEGFQCAPRCRAEPTVRRGRGRHRPRAREQHALGPAYLALDCAVDDRVAMRAGPHEARHRRLGDFMVAMERKGGQGPGRKRGSLSKSRFRVQEAPDDTPTAGTCCRWTFSCPTGRPCRAGRACRQRQCCLSVPRPACGEEQG